MNAFARIDNAAFGEFIQRQTEGRYEYVRGLIVQQMTGGTRVHGLVARRMTRLIEDQIEAKSWTVLPERGVETSQTIRYPEFVVEPADEPAKSLWTNRPSLIVEVLSPSSTFTDLDVKPGEYTSLASLETYIVASQDEPACLVWARGADGRFPAEPNEVEGREKIVTVRCGGQDIRLPLATIYEGIG